MRVALIGGSGFIGSHTAIALIESGHEVIVIDDLSQSTSDSLAHVEELTGKRIAFLQADARDETSVRAFLAQNAPVDAVVLLAGLKSVGESVRNPLRYYEVNVGIAVAVLAVMASLQIRTIIFSSSATVYRADNRMPLTEDSATGLDLSNPYGKSKRMIEEILADVARADPQLRVVTLRYFNPVGAHPSGLIGESPTGVPSNLMPIVSRTAAGALPRVDVFGDDYDTPDGTGLRDYIHVVDLAAGHVAALENAAEGHSVFNLGTGTPTSVLELIHAFEAECGFPIERRIVGRRPGDVAASYTDANRALVQLGWRSEHTIADAVRDQWRWQLRSSPRRSA